MIQFSLPVNRSCLCDSYKHRQNCYREKISYHVSFKAGRKVTPVNWERVLTCSSTLDIEILKD